jgi:hypothetical protein
MPAKKKEGKAPYLRELYQTPISGSSRRPVITVSAVPGIRRGKQRQDDENFQTSVTVSARYCRRNRSMAPESAFFHPGLRKLVHEGGFGLPVTDDGVLVFTRPDGSRVIENGHRCFRGNIAAQPRLVNCFDEPPSLYLINRDADVAITPETSRCQWRGERMDYSVAIEAMRFLGTRDGQSLAG